MVSLNLGLPALSLCASFLIRVLAAYLLCLALSRLCFQPRTRFLIWISFLLGAGAYWVLLLAAHIFGEPGAAATATSTAAGHRLLAGSVGLPGWSIPSAWSGNVEDAAKVLLCGYAATVASLALRLLYQRIHLRLIFRRAAPASRELDHIFSRLRHWTGAQRGRVLVLPGLMSPATAYTWNPCVLLPDFVESYLDQVQLEAVLCHELVHVKRRDYLWGTLADLVRCVAFFHPVIWLALRHLRRERELACDAAVIQECQCRRSDYAESLTRLTRVRLAAERSYSPINFATSGSFLGLRIRALFVETSRPSWWKRGAALMSGVALLSAFVAFWPALAIVLQFTPPPVAAVLHPVISVRRHRRTLRHRRLHFSEAEAEINRRPSLSVPRNVPQRSGSPLHASASTLQAIRGDAVAQAIRPQSKKSDTVNYSRTTVDAPPITRGPVWSESIPQAPPPSSPSWQSAAASIALDVLIHRPVGGADAPDGGGQGQAGNHLVSVLPHP
ncbi:MAG TPA: M56 family metallopeptidase [Blastocatellia bacterium]|nr:M56 family metallopeptidase [Blastocatellia bacterium]